ncbi:hypothetical protein PG984_009270 [Apiospora sp. TS-2023a]
MALDLRPLLANGLLCESTCRRHKMDHDTLCDRVEAWRDDPANATRCMFFDEDSEEIAKLSDVLIPDSDWQPGLQKTVANQLCAIQSAIDMLKARSYDDANKFGEILDDVRTYYTNPRNWPPETEDDHISMMLELLKYATEKSSGIFCYLGSSGKPEACYGRVAEALDQAFLYQERGLTNVSKQTDGLLELFRKVYSQATMLLYFEMLEERDTDVTYCMSTLGKPPQYPAQSTSSSPARTKKRKHDVNSDEEDHDTREAKKCGEKSALAPEICACRTVISKMGQTDLKTVERQRSSHEARYKRFEQGHNFYRRTTKPLYPSPLGQFFETAP